MSKNGFSLIEILIVMAIMVTLVTLGAGRIRRTETNVKQVMRNLAVLGKETRTHSRLKNATHRLVLDMPENSPHAYYVEYTPGPRAMTREKSEDDIKKSEGAAEPSKKSDFALASYILKTQKVLPKGFFFGQVETRGMKGPVKSGKAYLYFTPEGLVEEGVIQVTNRDRVTWSIYYNPLTGAADIIDRALSLKEVFDFEK